MARLPRVQNDRRRPQERPGGAHGPLVRSRREEVVGGLLSLHGTFLRVRDPLQRRVARGPRMRRRPHGGPRNGGPGGPPRMGLRPRAGAARDDPIRDPRHPPVLDGRRALPQAVHGRNHHQVQVVLEVPSRLQGHRLLASRRLRGERLLRDGPRDRRRPGRADGAHGRVHQPQDKPHQQVLPDHLPVDGPVADRRRDQRPPEQAPGGRGEPRGGGPIRVESRRTHTHPPVGLRTRHFLA
mmetsp:Transcript_6115/g.15138  ORF Transcript_6115/g.15138 Transcript_6115/m.15138 type:complete len:239 (+) Transcript_6115:951-1667(+)